MVCFFGEEGRERNEKIFFFVWMVDKTVWFKEAKIVQLCGSMELRFSFFRNVYRDVIRNRSLILFDLFIFRILSN